MPHLEDSFALEWSAVYAKLPNIIVTNSSQAGERTRYVATSVDLVAQLTEEVIGERRPKIGRVRIVRDHRDGRSRIESPQRLRVRAARGA